MAYSFKIRNFFFKWFNSFKKISTSSSSLHLIGLVSDGGVHSTQEHALSIARIARKSGIKNIFVHAFTDGRDTPPNSAEDFIRPLEEKINALKVREFEWKNPNSMFAGKQEGFIAQEVEAIIPEAVKEELMPPDPGDESRDFDGDVKLLRNQVINARLIKAVQELSAKLEAAEARITTLEG